MQVTDELIEKLARLSMLEFSENEKKEIREDLAKMIAFVEKLNELDTSGIEPLMHMSNEENVLRQDEIGNMLSKEEALQNAPAHNKDYFTVPKVIKKPQ